MSRASKETVKPFSREDYEAMAVRKHPVTTDQVVMAINGKLASGDFYTDCWDVIVLPYWFGEAEVKEAAEIFKQAGWNVYKADRRFTPNKPEDQWNWEFLFHSMF